MLAFSKNEWQINENIQWHSHTFYKSFTEGGEHHMEVYLRYREKCHGMPNPTWLFPVQRPDTLTVLEVEFTGGFGGPQSHGVDDVVPVAWDGRVIRQRQDNLTTQSTWGSRTLTVNQTHNRETMSRHLPVLVFSDYLYSNADIECNYLLIIIVKIIIKINF